MARRSHRLRPAARNRERLYADAFLRTGRPDGAKGKARPGAFARRVPALVRARQPKERRRDRGLWALVDARPGARAERADARFRLSVGRNATAMRLDNRRVYQVPSRQPALAKPRG